MLSGLLRTMRPHQWVKNLFVLAPLVFARELFEPAAALRAFAGFVAFCILAGSVYVLNDLVDVEADRVHPVKKNRPIASGRITVPQARGAFVVLVSLALGSALALGLPFFGAVAAYLVLQLLYSFRLKKVAYLDVLCIALGFELRVLAGSFAARVPASAYLLVVMFLLAAFLGLGKRAHELAALALRSGGAPGQTRAALRAYDLRTLTPLLYATGAATVLTYVVYTLDPRTVEQLGTQYLPLSALCTFFGVARFVHLVRRKADAESPTDAMLRDWPFLGNLGLWAAAVVAIVYFT